jgi:hypothetical protein
MFNNDDLINLEMDGLMNPNNDAKVTASTSILSEENESRIEKLLLKTGQEKIRISSWNVVTGLSQPLVLSEPELIEVFHQAIHAGVLTFNFLGKLQEKIEI